jgi:hypothetical protein
MSGLFGALIDAARGSAPAIMQRPRQVFAPFEAAPPLQEVNEEVRSERPAPARTPVREVRGELPEPAGRADSQRSPASSRAAQAVGTADEEVRTGPGARPSLPATQREAVVPPPLAERPAETRFLQVRADAEPVPRHEPAGPSEARDPAATQEMKLLLPELARPALPDPLVEGSEPDRPLFAPEPSERSEAGSGLARVELTIGRIEVAAPKTRLAAPHMARAVVVPRAKPRQTLDDYLARRRK